MTDITDDFNRANGGLGANWTNSSDLATAGVGALQISANAVVSSPSFNFFAAFYNASGFANDQYAQATALGVATAGTGVAARHQGSARSSFYSFFANIQGDAYLIRYDNGTINILTTFTALNVQSGDTVRLTVTGSTLTASVNGATVGSTTDATYSSGFPGLLVYSGQADNFLGGPIISVGMPPVGTSM